MKMHAILAAALVIAASLPHEAIGRTPIAVWDKDMDKGGNVDDFEAWVAETNRTGRVAVIRGKCWSACALKLAAKKVCIYPSAAIYFHGVHVEGSTTVLPEDNKRFVASFPRVIQHWIAKNRAMESVTRHTILTGRTAIRLGIPDCTSVIP